MKCNHMTKTQTAGIAILAWIAIHALFVALGFGLGHGAQARQAGLEPGPADPAWCQDCHGTLGAQYHENDPACAGCHGEQP